MQYYHDLQHFTQQLILRKHHEHSQVPIVLVRYADRVKELKSRDEGEKLTKEDIMQRELMLPRGNNKNTVKVNIERGDDQEDIMMKMGIARQMHENQQPFQKVEEKMDI